MEIKLYRPADPVLQPFIECFYTLKHRAGSPPTRYAAFPSVYSMVCLNALAAIDISGRDLSFSPDPDNPLECTLICDYDSAGWMTYSGEIDELVIYFKPLAINAFLANPLSTYVNSFITRFEPHADYRASMLEIFAETSGEKRIRMLEQYWRSKLIGFDHPFLHEALRDLAGEDLHGSIADLAERYGVSRTTFVKHFGQYMSTTPSQYRKVARFRHAMERHRIKNQSLNLSEISCEADYFDQSHMIKDFRSLTQLPPKAFFSRISTLEDGQINWLFA